MPPYQNILIVRTDRIGDVVLTTPAIAALRKAYPKARIAIMVTPQTQALVMGNPHLDSIIVFDREKAHNGLLGLWRFIRELRGQKFDLAVVYHTKKITNLICFLAGIPARLGYKNNKFGFLLTLPVKDVRPQGTRHETQLCLDLLKQIGIQKEEIKPYVPVSPKAERWIEGWLRENYIREDEPLIAIHPGASCISKRWPAESFVQLIEKISQRYPVKVLLIGTQDDKSLALKIISSSPQGCVVDTTGQTTVSQLVSLLKRCQVLISNDSGPVHIASALGIPVVAIFGRNQAGLSPTRWRPWGENSVVLHKEVGCPICLAHRCPIDFKCLKEIRPEEVFASLGKYKTFLS